MKKFFIYTIMCFLYITLTATTCDDSEYRMVCIRNNTSDTILLAMAPNMPRQQSFTLKEFFSYSVHDYDTIPPSENTSIGIYVDRERSLLSQKLFIFVFKPETLRNFTPEQLVERDYCDGKFFLNCTDLDRANYCLSYNGE